MKNSFKKKTGKLVVKRKNKRKATLNNRKQQKIFKKYELDKTRQDQKS